MPPGCCAQPSARLILPARRAYSSRPGACAALSRGRQGVQLQPAPQGPGLPLANAPLLLKVGHSCCCQVASPRWVSTTCISDSAVLKGLLAPTQVPVLLLAAAAAWKVVKAVLKREGG